MSDGINVRARIHNTVLSPNDTPLILGHFHGIGKKFTSNNGTILLSDRALTSRHSICTMQTNSFGISEYLTNCMIIMLSVNDSCDKFCVGKAELIA